MSYTWLKREFNYEYIEKKMMSLCLIFDEIQQIKKTAFFGDVKLHDFETIFFKKDSS